jgi:hypothetical protein
MLDDPRETTLESHYEYGDETDSRQKPETKADRYSFFC